MRSQLVKIFDMVKPGSTTSQSLGSLLKSARDIMRKDKGLNQSAFSRCRCYVSANGRPACVSWERRRPACVSWERGHPARIVKMKAGETRVLTSRQGRNVYNRRCKPADVTAITTVLIFKLFVFIHNYISATGDIRPRSQGFSEVTHKRKLSRENRRDCWQNPVSGGGFGGFAIPFPFP